MLRGRPSPRRARSWLRLLGAVGVAAVLLLGGGHRGSSLFCLSPSPASATIAVAMGFEDLVREADHVVVADVVSTQAGWNATHTAIHTTVELAIVESWKGPLTPSQHVTLVQPGGTVDDITMSVSGLSRFTPGERSLLFLRNLGTNLSVVGLAQGKRPLQATTVGHERRWTVSPPATADLMLVRRKRGSTPAPMDTSPITLEEMRARVRDALARTKTP